MSEGKQMTRKEAAHKIIVSVAHTWKWLCMVSVVVKTIQAQLPLPAVACLSSSSCAYATAYYLTAAFIRTFSGTVNVFSGFRFQKIRLTSQNPSSKRSQFLFGI